MLAFGYLITIALITTFLQELNATVIVSLVVPSGILPSTFGHRFGDFELASFDGLIRQSVDRHYDSFDCILKGGGISVPPVLRVWTARWPGIWIFDSHSAGPGFHALPIALFYRPPTVLCLQSGFFVCRIHRSQQS